MSDLVKPDLGGSPDRLLATKERPILLGAPMVLKLLAGEKTQTRRIIKPQPTQEGSTLWWKGLAYDLNKKPLSWMEKRLCPYGQVREQLWVRETWAEINIFSKSTGEFLRHDIVYRAENPNYETRYRPSIFMPRRHSRITLEITGVKVERVEDISPQDAIAPSMNSSTAFIEYFYQLSPEFAGMNPWVWCLSFQREQASD